MDEVLNLADAAVNQLSRFNQGPAVQQGYASPAPQGYAQQPSRFDLDIGDDDFLTGKQLKQLIANANQQAAMQSNAGDPVARQLAAGSTMVMVRQLESDAFRRWAPEIELYISQIPMEMRTLDNLQRVVQLVKGQHVQELVDEQARQLASRLQQEQLATIRSGTGGLSGSPQTEQTHLQSSELPQQWRELAASKGLTMDDVDEFCKATGDTREQFFETVKKFGAGAAIRG